MKSHRKEPAPRTRDDWSRVAKSLLKAELAKRDIGYLRLTQLLAELGVHETPENVNNKINRGKFSAAFLFQCLAAVDCKVLRLTEE